MTLVVRAQRDSTQDLDLVVVGKVEGVLEGVVYDPVKYKEDHVTVRVVSIMHAIQSGCIVRLLWESEENTLMVPLEGRGVLDLSRFGGLENPRLSGTTGRILLHAHAQQAVEFTLCLELVKQRS